MKGEVTVNIKDIEELIADKYNLRQAGFLTLTIDGDEIETEGGDTTILHFLISSRSVLG